MRHARRPGTRRSRGAVASALATSLLVAGCAAEPVPVPERELSPGAATACRDVVDALPETLGDRDRVEVTPADALGAAWGDPAIVLTCGGEVPDDFGRTAVCQEADGVGWYVADAVLDDEALDVTLSTVGYRPIVTVLVPASERPEGVATAMAALAPAVAEHTELVRPCR